MYKFTLIPDKKNHNIEMPEKFFGKKVEVIIVEVGDKENASTPVPPLAKKIKVKDLFESFGAAPDFPPTEEIKSKPGYPCLIIR